jgi:small subunit ribosomal protein S17
MAKEKTQKIEMKEQTTCNDVNCPFHGTLSTRGRAFQGVVIKKFHKRVVIELERTIYIQKFERYAKSKTKLHARLPDCLASEVNIGDYIEINECRKLSKIVSFVVTKRLKTKAEMENQKSNKLVGEEQ